MKTPSDDLYKFIQSLDRSELAYLRREIANDQATIHSEMFDYLVNHKTYDELVVITKFKSFTKTPVKHIKQNFWNYVLRKLAIHHSGYEYDRDSYNLLLQVKILLKKKSFKKANSLLKKAFVQAKEIGNFLIEIELLKTELQLVIETENIRLYNNLKAHHKKRFESLMYANFQLQNYALLLIELKNIWTKSGFNINEEELHLVKKIHNKYIEIKSESNLKEQYKALQVHENIIEHVIFLFQHNFKESFVSYSKFINEVSEHKHDYILPEEFFWYLNCGISLSILTHNPDLLTKLHKISTDYYNDLPLREKNNAVSGHFLSIKNNIVAFYTHIENFEKAKKLGEEIWNEMHHEQVKQGAFKIFMANMCQVYLCLKDYKNSLHCYNKIMNNKTFVEVRKDINTGVYVLGLSLFIKLKMESNFESLIRFLRRSTIIDKKMQKFYIEILALIIKIPISDNKQLKVIKNEVITIIQNNKRKEVMFFIENTKLEYIIKNVI